jgi:hypothetical protein
LRVLEREEEDGFFFFFFLFSFLSFFSPANSKIKSLDPALDLNQLEGERRGKLVTCGRSGGELQKKKSCFFTFNVVGDGESIRANE